MNPRSDRTGLRCYTLVEMLAVLALLAAVLAIAIPRIGVIPAGVQRRHVQDLFREAFFCASSLAISSGQQVDVLYLPDPDKLQIECSKPNEVLRDLKVFHLPTGALKVVFNEPRDDVRFRFFPDGEAQGPELNGEMLGERIRFGVDPVTGRLVWEVEGSDR